MSDGGFDPRETFCQNPECDECIHIDFDDIFRVTPPRGQLQSSGLNDVYCSARCVARGMAEHDGVNRVNVYDEDETNRVTPGGVTDDD